MSKVAIITDSTAYIPKELVEQYQITVVPQVLIWGDETLRDDIDIKPTEFYTRLATAEVMPTTSQATPADFKTIYEKLHGEGKEILVILVSDLLSKTVNSAQLASDMVPDAKVEILNSTTTAMEMGFLVLAAARAAEKGATLEECKEIAVAAKERSGVIFAVDTLEFLHRGGRIGGASRFLGTALKLKPLLELSGGRIEALERVRTKKKAHDRLMDLIVERVKGKENIRLASLHANAADDARELLERISALVNPVEAVYSEVSPVIGSHVGPGTIGIAYMTD
jgi:DegV family protein with EDD domain